MEEVPTQGSAQSITLAALGALALGALSMTSAPSALADGSDGGSDAIEALVGAVPRDGSGWANGTATPIPERDRSYRLQYQGGARGGVGPPGIATMRGGNTDGSLGAKYWAASAAAAPAAQARQLALTLRS